MVSRAAKCSTARWPARVVPFPTTGCHCPPRIKSGEGDDSGLVLDDPIETRAKVLSVPARYGMFGSRIYRRRPDWEIGEQDQCRDVDHFTPDRAARSPSIADGARGVARDATLAG